MTKHQLALQVAEALGRPEDEATVAAYEALPLADLRVQARMLPGVVARLKAEGQWRGQ